ncbi:hypothetical protein [Arthrobacter sp. CAL618]|uniref:hypothetical protein n=1 Tax=Arthrobacter sp. CAL618 TaxID=1055770 RepID=UPI00041231FB|nr:hypothetical protein [Arthrobacter sp. CAL618]
MTNEKRYSLVDPASPAFGVASTAVMGAVTLVDPSRLDGQQRRVMRVVSAVVSGLYVGVTIGGKRLPLRALAGVVTGAATLRFADTSEAIDLRLENKLRQVGIQHPRRWMAAGTAAFIAAGFVGDRAAARRREFLAMLEDQSEQVRPLDSKVRKLVRGILSASEERGAQELRAQLDAAEEVYWDDEFTGTAYFKVPEGLPRAVPHNQVYPVRARFIGPDGASHQVLVQVLDGMIDHITAEVTNQEDADQVEGLLEGWPDAAEVVYVLDSTDGTSTTIG